MTDFSDLVNIKKSFRSRRLTDRRDIAPDVRAEADRAVCRVVAGLVRALPARTSVAGHCPMPGEPGGPELVAAMAGALPPGGDLLLPVLLPDRELDWARYTGTLVPGPYRLREPDGPRLGPGAIGTAGLVIVPAVAVDRSGVRLGRGGGSYDRALGRAGSGVPVVALLYPGELVDRLPAGPHDRPVSAVADPSGTIPLPHRDG